MRKRIIRLALGFAATQEAWLDLDKMASVELTSEDPVFPIEFALSGEDDQGWRAAEAGEQTIRVVFDQPQSLRRISLVFEETEIKRTQEFTLRWSPDRGKTFQEIVRQQWNFSSPDATREAENCAVELSNVTLLDLTIEPDKERREARASLLSLRVA
jgi:F5/8 type C domain